MVGWTLVSSPSLLAKSSLASEHSVSFSLKIAEEFQAGDVVIPEAEARKLEKAIEDILVAMGLGEDSSGAPALRK